MELLLRRRYIDLVLIHQGIFGLEINEDMMLLHNKHLFSIKIYVHTINCKLETARWYLYNNIKYNINIIYFYFISGVIVFGSDQEVAELMKAVKRLNATGQFFWIGSDGWSARALVSDGKFNKYWSFRSALYCSFPK